MAIGKYAVLQWRSQDFSMGRGRWQGSGCGPPATGGQWSLVWGQNP